MRSVASGSVGKGGSPVKLLLVAAAAAVVAGGGDVGGDVVGDVRWSLSGDGEGGTKQTVVAGDCIDLFAETVADIENIPKSVKTSN